jgi:putative tricarboxylic transport membrane protein
METLTNLAEGFSALFSGWALLAVLAGVFIGSLVGVLPGIGPVGAMAVLLPVSFTLGPTTGLLMIAGIYFGSMYGGSTTSILMRVPGEASSVVASIDGHEMTKRGRAGAALAVAAIGSFIAGTLAVVLLMLVANPLSTFAGGFSAPEFLALTIFALLVLSRLTGGSFAGTMVAAGLGLLLATIGLDEQTGNARFIFGQTELAQGLEVTPVAVGLFGIAEVLLLAEQRGRLPALPTVRLRDLYPTKRELRRSVPAMFRGGILGFFFGLFPGPAAATSSYASYMLERRVSGHKEEFGKGAIEGVAGPEAANNGAAGGAMIPLLILGIPFNAVAALLLAGFTIHGAIPGPLFIENEPGLFWGLIAGMYVANIMLLILNLPLVGMFTSVLRVPRDIQLALILVIAVVGTYATRNSMLDVVWLLIMGALGYFMVKVGLPRTALILAFVIAALMEESLVQTMSLANGDPAYILERPIALSILVLTALILLAPWILKLLGNTGLARGLQTIGRGSDEG